MLNWTINVGEVITWLIAISGFCFTVGRVIQRVDHLAEEADEHYDSFQRHEAADVDRFDNLNSSITMIASKLMGGK